MSGLKLLLEWLELRTVFLLEREVGFGLAILRDDYMVPRELVMEFFILLEVEEEDFLSREEPSAELEADRPPCICVFIILTNNIDI